MSLYSHTLAAAEEAAQGELVLAVGAEEGREAGAVVGVPGVGSAEAVVLARLAEAGCQTGLAVGACEVGGACARVCVCARAIGEAGGGGARGAIQTWVGEACVEGHGALEACPVGWAVACCAVRVAGAAVLAIELAADGELALRA
jgi:hypothetical protein